MPAKKVNKVLLCRPSYFTVDYIINPHMKPYSVDQKLALKQWQKLVEVLQSIDIEVEVIDQKDGLPDMVFATDQGIVRGNDILLANFRYPQRQKETLIYREWFKDYGFNLKSLSNAYPFEGGDTLFFGDLLFVGTGYRASVASCEELAQKLKIDVMPLRLIDPAYYHLDTCFLPIDENYTFYYPAAFSQNSQNIIKRLVSNPVELSSQEAESFAANSFVSGKDILIQSGTPVSFTEKLEKIGMKVHTVDVSEFNKAGGGIHCLINTIG